MKSYFDLTDEEKKSFGYPTIPLNEDLRHTVEKFLQWVKEHDVKFLLSEQMAYSKLYRFVGTLDFICKYEGNMYIGDLKTNKNIYYNSMGSQVAAYKIAREEEFPNEKYAGGLIVRVGLIGDLQFWKFTETKIFEDNFLNTLRHYQTEEQIKRLEQSGQFK